MYVGQSNNIAKRHRTHRNDLRKNKHHNAKLQGHWNKYGEESFSFEVIQECKIEDLTVLEQTWLDLFKQFGEVFNFADIVDSPWQGRTLTKETKAKLSKAGKGRPHSADHKRNISRSLSGRAISTAHRESISKARIGNTYRALPFKLRSPSGELFEGLNLKQFALSQGLCPKHLGSVRRGKRPHHRGWTKA